jgi:hypothetical protein
MINEEFDMVIKEAIDIWSSICELIKIQEKELAGEGYNKGENNGNKKDNTSN